MKIDNLREAWQKKYRESQQRPWWFKLIFAVIVIFVVITIIGILTPEAQKSRKEGAEEGKKSASEVSPLPQGSPSPTPSQSVLPQTFDENRGNNPVAAELAQQLFDQANEAKQGFVLDIHISLDPEDMQGKDKENYIKTVRAAALAMQVDSSLWSSFDEGTQRGFVTLYLKYPLGIFPSTIVGITIIDSNDRIVAKGTYDKSTNKTNITLM